MEQYRILAGAALILVGVFIFIVATAGLFRFHYVLNRVHAAATCDSLAVLLVCVGLMFFSAEWGSILKLSLVAMFVWLSNPVATHLVCKIEVETNDKLEDECKVEARP